MYPPPPPPYGPALRPCHLQGAQHGPYIRWYAFIRYYYVQVCVIGYDYVSPAGRAAWRSEGRPRRQEHSRGEEARHGTSASSDGRRVGRLRGNGGRKGGERVSPTRARGARSMYSAHPKRFVDGYFLTNELIRAPTLEPGLELQDHLRTLEIIGAPSLEPWQRRSSITRNT